MKVLFSLYALSFFCIVQQDASAQKMPSDWFEEGVAFIEDTNYDEAAKCFRYIADHHRNNSLFPKSYYNLGLIYMNTGKTEEAKAIYTYILHSDFNEKEERGGDIMGPPYANFRHEASSAIKAMYYREGQYDSALKYLVLSDTVYPFIHFCGNAYEAYSVYSAMEYADLYMKLKDTANAEQKLLSVTFVRLGSNKEAIDMLINDIYKGRSDIKSIQEELKYGLNHIYTRKNPDYDQEDQYLPFRGHQLYIPEDPFPYNELDGKDGGRKSTREYVLQSYFYNAVMDL